jgi:hypothetical protein
MQIKETNPARLVIEESLHILEDCIQCDALSAVNSTIIRQHIQRLKYFYSPWFDFTHAESGSYFYAALHCMQHKYINQADFHSIIFTKKFSDSISCLTNVSLYALNPRSHKSLFIEDLIKLGHIWQYSDYDDMQSLLLFALQSMREDFQQSNKDII